VPTLPSPEPNECNLYFPTPYLYLKKCQLFKLQLYAGVCDAKAENFDLHIFLIVEKKLL
jgi:hypothetical protein